MSTSFYEMQEKSAFGPASMSPVRWHREQPTATAAAAAAAPHGVSIRECGGAPPQVVDVFASSSSATVEDLLRHPPASLPKGWQPVSDEYDDTVHHRLWTLEDGSNLAARATASPLNNMTITSTPHSTSHHSLQGRVTTNRPPRLPTPAAGAQIAPQGDGSTMAMVTSSTVGLDSAVLAASLRSRPVSGDVLLRKYQLKSLAQQAAAAISATTPTSSSSLPRAASPSSIRQGTAESIALRPGVERLGRLEETFTVGHQRRATSASSPLRIRSNSFASKGTEIQQHQKRLPSMASFSPEEKNQQQGGGGVMNSNRVAATEDDDGEGGSPIQLLSSGSQSRIMANSNSSMSAAGSPWSPITVPPQARCQSAQQRIQASATRIAALAAALGSHAVEECPALQDALRKNALTMQGGRREEDTLKNTKATTLATPLSTTGSVSLRSAAIGGGGVGSNVSSVRRLRMSAFDRSGVSGAAEKPENSNDNFAASSALVRSVVNTAGGGTAMSWDAMSGSRADPPQSGGGACDITAEALPPADDTTTQLLELDPQNIYPSGKPQATSTTTPTTTTSEDDALLAVLAGLSNEDIMVLASLVGSDGIMSGTSVTDDMWHFEYDTIRATETHALNEARASLLHPTTMTTGSNKISFLSDGGPQLSLSAKSAKRRRSSIKRAGGEEASERLSETLMRKLKALERQDQSYPMPQICVATLDVLSGDFEGDLKRVNSATRRWVEKSTNSADDEEEEEEEEEVEVGSDGKNLSGEGGAPPPRPNKKAGGTPTTNHLRHVATEETIGCRAANPTTLRQRRKEDSPSMVPLTAAAAAAAAAGGGTPVATPTATGALVLQNNRRTSQTMLENFFGRQAKKVVPEGETFIPSNELHLYQLYCLNTNMILIFRPVSPSVPPMYAGNFFVPAQYCDADGIPLTINEIDSRLTLKDVLSFTTAECRVKGKGIGVSLKSSPYPPIDGFIPINPSLSKTYSEARKKERALEDTLINNASGGGDAISTALLRKMRSQKSLFSAATSVAMKEIEASLKDSDKRLTELLDQYHEASSYAQDKLAVAQEYIGVLNEMQFLGKTIATWRGLPIYFKQASGDADVERRENAHPIFYLKKGNDLVVYDLERNELDVSRTTPIIGDVLGTLYHPVYILTHKSFVISPISRRIEPDPLGDFLIGPDFDGFAFATHIGSDLSAEQYQKFSEAQMDLRVLPTMGLVNDIDVEHILEMRRLTEWKQSHGYECSNTLKTQEISDGPHVIIMPDEVRLAFNFPELMEFYREAWQCGYPLLLNPNWKVVVSPVDHLPMTFGDELSIPVVDDCGLALVKHHLASVGKKFDDLKDEAVRYIEELVALRKQGVTRLRATGMYSTSLIPKVATVVARKKLAEKFFMLRRWMLFPPMFDPSKLQTFEANRPSGGSAAATATSNIKTPTNINNTPSQQGRPPTSAFNSGSNRKVYTVPIIEEFEVFRQKHIEKMRVKFDEECATFDAIFGSEDNRFVKRLKQFTEPQFTN